MKGLFLEDLKDMSLKELTEHVIEDYRVTKKIVMQYDFLIAYEYCANDAHSFFLLKNKKTGLLYENHGRHCSCYGFEDQFKPEETTIKYLLSDKFSLSDYENDEFSLSLQKIINFIKKLRAKSPRK